MAIILKKAGFQVSGVADSKKGFRRLNSSYPDMIVMADESEDAQEICSGMKDMPYLPILLLGQGDDGKRARMIDMGADMYVSSAIGNDELIARIYALLRRCRKRDRENPVNGSGGGRIEFGNDMIKLTPTEFRLFSCLMLHGGKVIPYRQIISRVWEKEVSLDTLHFYARRLKQRLDNNAEGRYRLLNYRGQGYCFCEVDPGGGYSDS